MAWVKFNRVFDFTPAGDRRVTVEYLADTTHNVTAECAAQAVAVGAAEKVKAPPRNRAEANAVRAGHVMSGLVTPVIGDDGAALNPPASDVADDTANPGVIASEGGELAGGPASGGEA